MKNKRFVFLLDSIVIAVLSVLALFFMRANDTVYWIGFFFLLVSFVFSGVMTCIAGKDRRDAFPVEISMVGLTVLYVVLTAVINFFFDFLFHLEYKAFLSIHLLCLAAVAVITLLLFAIKSAIVRQNSAAISKTNQQQMLVYELEKVGLKLSGLPALSRGKAAKILESLLDDLKYANYSDNIDVSDIDDQIRLRAAALLTEVNNLIEIESDDLQSFEFSIGEIRQLVADRNMQIKLMSHTI